MDSARQARLAHTRVKLRRGVYSEVVEEPSLCRDFREFDKAMVIRRRALSASSVLDYNSGVDHFSGGEELTLENPITGERVIFRQRAHETDGARVVIDHHLKPHTGTFPEHIQLNQDERFEILSGTATISLNGVQKTAQAGDVILAPRGTPHRNPWNESNLDMAFRHETSPDFGSDVYFESLFSLAQAGKINRKGEVNALQIIVIGAGLKSQTYLTAFPIIAQKIINRILAAIGRLLGYPSRYSLSKAGKP